MRGANRLLHDLLFPPKWVLILLSSVSFPLLVVIFVGGLEESVISYPIYLSSAYSLTIISIRLPALIRWIKRMKSALVTYDPQQKSRLITFAKKYSTDYFFRGSVGIYQGLTVNFAYMLYRYITALWYGSVWFFSVAVFYMVLIIMRAQLARGYRRRETRGRD